jgi:hypothetical protein
VKAICADPRPFRGSQTPILDQVPFTEGLIPDAIRRLLGTQRARTPRDFRIARMRERHKPQSIVLVLLKRRRVAEDVCDFCLRVPPIDAAYALPMCHVIIRTEPALRRGRGEAVVWAGRSRRALLVLTSGSLV